MDLDRLKATPSWEWPEGTDAVLLGVLNDVSASHSDRLIAVELAGDFCVVNDEICDALLSIVAAGDQPEELRGSAAISLGPVLEYADTVGFDDPDEEPISERAFGRIQTSLHRLFSDAAIPRDTRRRILEASVCGPQDWHTGAVRAAYASDDEAWRLTAVFCMRFIGGFDDEILASLESDDPDIHYQAVCAAGNWELEAAWSHVAALATAEDADKNLRLAAIEAVADIRPPEALRILEELTVSDDDDIVEAAFDALAMAGGGIEEDGWDEEEDDA